MGIACLAATGRKEVLDRLPSEIFNMFLDCFGEIREAYSSNADSGSALYVSGRSHSDNPSVTI